MVATSVSSTFPKSTRLFYFLIFCFICLHDEIIIRINETKTRIIRATYGPWSAALHCAALHYTPCFRPSSYRLLVTSPVFRPVSDWCFVSDGIRFIWHLLACLGLCLLDWSNSRIHCTTGEGHVRHLDSGHGHESVLEAIPEQSVTWITHDVSVPL